MELDSSYISRRGFGGDGIPFGDVGDQKGIRGIHQKRSGQDRSEQGVFFHQREHDVVQIGVAGENIGFAQVNGTSAGFDMELLAGLIGREIFFKYLAEGSGFPAGLQGSPRLCQ